MSERADGAESLGKRMQALRGEARLAAIGEVVSRWRESGQSQAASCREAGIATVTLGRWLRQLEAAKAAKSPEPVLVELGVHEKGGDDHEALQVTMKELMCVLEGIDLRDARMRKRMKRIPA